MRADDLDLVREFAASGSDVAFATLVERHLNLVYSVAFRRLGNPHEAEEVAQVVFIILAKKAGSLRQGTILSGWLYQTAQLTAANFLRSKIRREHREQEAFMQFSPEPSAWPQLSPFLEDAMSRLKQKERDVIILRFFENRTVAEVAAALGLGEAAAQKRVNRATDKLRKFFASRGLHVSANGMLDSIGTHAVQIAPAGLVLSITTASVVKGAAASGSTLTLLKGALKVMAWTKAKTAIVTGVAVLLAAGTTTVVVTKFVAAPISKPSPADLSWANDPRYWATDSSVLDKIPRGVVIFRPTQFASSGGAVWTDHGMSGKNESVSDLLDQAYGFSSERTVFADDMPNDHLDVMITKPNFDGLIKDELKKRYGLSAHKETREADVLVLKVQNPNPPNLKRNSGFVSSGTSSSWRSSPKGVTIQNMEPSGFFGSIESQLQFPVIDETGLKGRYDLKMKWQPKQGETEKNAFKRALLEQLGLALVPERRSITMLVVDTAK